MLRKFNVYFCLLLLTAGYVFSSVVPTELCPECEEEIWEEVPCDQVIPNTTTTVRTTTTTTYYAKTTTTTPIPTTTRTTTTTTTTKPPPTTYTTTQAPPTTTQPPVYTTPTPSSYLAKTTPSSDQYKNCYCECKIGCKEFCRKVVINSDPKKHITQTSKILQQIQPGRVEINHIHERIFSPGPYIAGNYQKAVAVPVPVPEPIPTPKPTGPEEEPAGNVYPIESSAEIDQIYDSPKPAINSASSASTAAYPGRQQSNYYQQNAVINTPSYSLDELTKLLTSPAGYNNQPYAYYSQNQQQQDYNQQTYGSQGTPPVPSYTSPQYSQQQNQAQIVNEAYYQPSQANNPSSSTIPSNSQQPQQYAQQYSQVPKPNVASYSNGPAQNSAAAAAASVASSSISDTSNANYHINQADNSNLQYPQDSSYTNPALNGNSPPINFNLDSYLKDYVYTHQTSVNAYPDYQLSYPSY